MKQFLPIALMLAAAGCSTSTPTATRSQTVSPSTDWLAAAKPVSSGNITLIPVVSAARPSASPAVETISLAEAQKNGWVKVTDAESGASAVTVSNTGPKPILAMGGELLQGGHQDQIVQRDTLIQPGETKEVPCFCVEEGRGWGETDKFKVSMTLAPLRVRRMAQITGKQELVWSGVDSFNAVVGVNAKQESVHAGLEGSVVQERISADADKLIKAASAEKGAVGVVIAIDGEVKAFECFGTPELYKSSLSTVVRGALADAASGKGTSKQPSLADVSALVADALHARRTSAGIQGWLSRRRIDDKGIVGVETVGPGSQTDLQGTLIRGTYLR